MAFMYYGKKYDTKAELKAAQKKAVGTKGKKKIGNIFEGRLAKEKRAAKASVAQGKANTAASNTMKSAEKKYAKDSMFAKAADNRDKAKTTPGKKRSFKEAFDAATKEGKSKFMLGGKGYLTAKGKRENRFDPTKTKGAEKKESIFSKFKSSKTGSEFFKKLKKKK
jgi:hypothetical protein